MNTDHIATVLTSGAAALGVLVTWLSLKRTARRDKTDIAQQIIDQIQEERDAAVAAVRAERDDLRGEVARVKALLDRAEERERVLLDYVSQLRVHIDGGAHPPPPPWPPSLTVSRT